MDPAILLDETDDFRWAARVAAYNVVIKDKNDAQSKAKSRTKK